MKLLVLGGTHFAGRNFLETWIARYGPEEVTIFQRGLTGAHLFPGVQRVLGHRETDDICQLARDSWDLVVDFSCYFPATLSPLLTLLKERAGLYIFISTISVYDTSGNSPVTEDSTLYTCTEDMATDTSVQSYGPRKAACEKIIAQIWKENYLIFRPSLIYGPYDPTDRFYYWIYRTAMRGSFLIPEEAPQYRMNFTDVKDMALVLCEAATHTFAHTTYNLTTHTPNTLMERLILFAAILQKEPRRIEIPLHWLKKHYVQPWASLPTFYPADLIIENHRLLAEGLSPFRSFEDSVQDVISYYKSKGFPQPDAGLEIAEEAQLIMQWMMGG